MINLLSNAIKFSYPNDDVKVIVESKIVDNENLEVMITVVDFGIGITPEDQKNLFKPYFKTSDTKSK